MTWRRLRVLITHLPPESATMTALRNAMTDEEYAEAAEQGEPEKGRWSQTEQLLALNGDLLKEIKHILICANSEKKKWPDPPEPTRRPGAQPRKKKTPPLTEHGAERLFQLINGGAA